MSYRIQQIHDSIIKLKRIICVCLERTVDSSHMGEQALQWDFTVDTFLNCLIFKFDKKIMHLLLLYTENNNAILEKIAWTKKL